MVLVLVLVVILVVVLVVDVVVVGVVAPRRWRGPRRYRAFTRLLLPARQAVRPLGAAELARLVQDIYAGLVVEVASSGSRPRSFPDMVHAIAARRWGLRAAVSQRCWCLVYSVDRLKSSHLFAGLFGRLLDESMDRLDLHYLLRAWQFVVPSASRPGIGAAQAIHLVRRLLEQEEVQSLISQRLSSGEPRRAVRGHEAAGQAALMQQATLMRLDAEMTPPGGGPEAWSAGKGLEWPSQTSLSPPPPAASHTNTHT
ncbi:unnamed protein product, partial [Prorocentrum cordatum]